MGKIKRKKIQKQASEAGKSTSAKGDVIAVFGLTFVLALILQKLQLFIDWDTLDSVLKMNTPGYNPLINPPSHYHLLLEPLVYLTTALFGPVLGHDHLVGYVILISAFAAGLLALAYYTVYRVTGNRLGAWISVAFIGVSYNFAFLTFTIEDNIINQFFNLSSIFLAFAVIGIIRIRADQRLVGILFGISIALAIGTNLRSLYLLTLLPAVVLLCKDRLEGLKNAGLSLATLAFVEVGVILASIVAAGKALSLESFLGFFSVGYYSDPRLWYFANPSLTLSAELIMASNGFIRSLFGDYVWIAANGVSEWLPVLAAIGIIIVVAVVILSGRWKEPAIVILAMLFLINTVNSFFYEPKSLERWDHAVLLIGILAGLVWSSKPSAFEKGAVVAIIPLMAIGTLLLFVYVGSIISFATFGYERVPAGVFQSDPGLVITQQKPTAEHALYLKYLYGPDNVIFVDRSASAQDVLSTMKQANRTVYYDFVLYGRCMELEEGTMILSESRALGESPLLWYVYHP